ncbi:MAG: glycosyltransferase family 4 protein [Flavobacterium sp.]
MKPLRILYVVTRFPSVTETFIATQIAGMLEQGHDCTIFSYERSADEVIHQIISDYKLQEKVIYHFKNESGFLKKGVGVLRFLFRYASRISFTTLISICNPFRWAKVKEQRLAYWDMPVFLLDTTYDVIHCHFGFNAVKLTRAYQARIVPKSRFVVSFHGSDLTPSKIPQYQELYRDLFAVFDAFTVNTPYLKSLLLQVKPDLVSVPILPVGFHSDYLDPFLDLPKDDSLFRLVYCGRLMSLKGPDVAIRILSELHTRGYAQMRLVLIGSGEEEVRLRTLALTLEVDSFITWAGAVSQKAVFHLMGTSDVFLYTGRVEEGTGRAETQGLVIQEAQYLKLPVVVADVGGVCFGVQPELTGFLVKNEDINEFVEKILFLYHNTNERIKFAENAHKWIKNNYSIRIHAQILLKIYFNGEI